MNVGGNASNFGPLRAGCVGGSVARLTGSDAGAGETLTEGSLGSLMATGAAAGHPS